MLGAFLCFLLAGYINDYHDGCFPTEGIIWSWFSIFIIIVVYVVKYLEKYISIGGKPSKKRFIAIFQKKKAKYEE